MTFIKSLFLAIVATLFITYVLGFSLIELLHLNVYTDGELMDPLSAIGASAVAMVMLVLIALAIVLSVFGSIIFIGIMILGAFILLAQHVFWPIILIVLIIGLLSAHNRSKQNTANQSL